MALVMFWRYFVCRLSAYVRRSHAYSFIIMELAHDVITNTCIPLAVNFFSDISCWSYLSVDNRQCQAVWRNHKCHVIRWHNIAQCVTASDSLHCISHPSRLINHFTQAPRIRPTDAARPICWFSLTAVVQWTTMQEERFPKSPWDDFQDDEMNFCIDQTPYCHETTTRITSDF